MNIGVKLDDLANNLRGYAGVAHALCHMLEADCGESSLQYHAADTLECGLLDIERKMRILADCAIERDKQSSASNPQPDPFKVWLKTHIHGETQWHLATEKQIDQIRELLDHDDLATDTAENNPAQEDTTD